MPIPQSSVRMMESPLGSSEATLLPVTRPRSPRRSQVGRRHLARTAAIHPHASRSNALDWFAKRTAPAVSGASSQVGNSSS